MKPSGKDVAGLLSFFSEEDQRYHEAIAREVVREITKALDLLPSDSPWDVILEALTVRLTDYVIDREELIEEYHGDEVDPLTYVRPLGNA